MGPLLILGAGGLVGQALVRAGPCAALPRAQLDLTDDDAVAVALDRLAPAAVINAAAMAAVDQAERDPGPSHQVNALAPGRLAARCRARGIRLLHLSTDYVLHSEGAARLTEDLPRAPQGTYARHKAEGEEAALREGALVVRVQWVYHPGAPCFFSRALRALAHGAPLRLVHDQVGCPTPADALAAALRRAAEGGPTGLFHLATEGEATPLDWIGAAAAFYQLPLRAERVSRAGLGGAPRPARSCLDSARFAAVWGGLSDWRDALHEALTQAGSGWLSA